ncbi:FUSC family protein [Oribacterium sp. NK2B42]|uniref:FUSC family protein n=1 Tax=Oribacterium sp. NK2B42 TaxID=689781 RepID=UPI00041E63E6|nr:FUSC family protein [Oribacterium sp. NK2B42]
MEGEKTSRFKTVADKLKMPKYTNRIIRTVIACFVTAVIYKYLLGDRNPCFACIGAVYGMGSQFQEGFHNGFNRFVGTFIGGLVVIPSYWLYMNTPFGIPGEVYLCIGVFFVMLINFVLGANNAIQPGTVVYFVVLCTQPVGNFVSYTIARIIDTGVGVLISLGISMLRPTMIDREKGVDLLTFFEAMTEGFRAWSYANKCGSLPQLDAEGRAAKREERKARYIERHSF